MKNHILVLSGSPRERGRAHGETLKPEIIDNVKTWKADIAEANKCDPDLYLQEFLNARDYFPAIEKWAPEVLEEVRGIGEGAGIDFQSIFAFQLMDEEWKYNIHKNLDEKAKKEHCTGMGIFGEFGEAPILAQNMDLPNLFDGTQKLFHIKYPDSYLESFIFSFSGLIGLTGMNNRSIGICCNTLKSLNYAVDGLPVAFIVRGVLSKVTGDEAENFVKNIRHASGQNYLIGSPSRVMDFECSANQVKSFSLYPGATRVYHTNHPLVNNDQSMYKEAFDKLSNEDQKQVDAFHQNTLDRFSFVEKELKDLNSRVDENKVKQILSSREVPVCFDRAKDAMGITFGTLIMKLSALPELYISFGPPSSEEFEIYRF